MTEGKKVHAGPVMPDEVDMVWEDMAPYFQNFADRSDGSISAARLLHDVLRGSRQCFVAVIDNKVRAVLLTEICKLDMEVILLNFVSGEEPSTDWRDELLQAVKDYAKARADRIGQPKARLVGIHRPGWKKYLQADGWKMTHCMSEIDV